MIRTALFATLLLLLPAAVAAGRRPMEEMDLYRLAWPADPQISPDGATVLFVRVTADTVQNGYQTGIWTVPAAGGESRQLTAGRWDSAPRWSPDGRRVAFLRPGPDGTPQIWMLSLNGGEAFPLTDIPGGAGPPLWSPDGAWIAFLSDQPADSAGGVPPPPRNSGAWVNDLRVITRPVFRRNGVGFLDEDREPHAWIVSAGGGAPRRATGEPFAERLAAWSPDASTLYYLSDRRAEPWLGQDDQDLYAVPRAGGAPAPVVDIEGPLLRAALHAGGRWAFLGRVNPPEARSYAQDEILVAGPVPRERSLRAPDVTSVTAGYDFEIGNHIATDVMAPRGGNGWSPVWSRDGRTVFAVVSERGESAIARIGVADGKVTRITPARSAVLGFSADAEARRFAFLLADATHPPEVWTCDERGGGARRLTALNDSLLAAIQVVGADRIPFEAPDGMPVDAWLMKPVDYVPWGRYPLVVQIHGGPHLAYGESFFHEFQTMAGRGYMVLFVNPRGSTTYGRAFAEAIQYDWPGGDLHDILAGVDAAAALAPVDTLHMGVTGGSGGGYLTNWMIVNSRRFRAAAADRCVSEWLSFFYTADFPMYAPFWFRSRPWQDPMEYVQRSPVYFAERVRTPLLLLHAEEDLTTPINQAEAMFRALKGLRREVVLVRIPGENHDLSRTGTPRRRVERLRHLVGWFDKHLKGERVALYDDAIAGAP